MLTSDLKDQRILYGIRLSNQSSNTYHIVFSIFSRHYMYIKCSWHDFLLQTFTLKNENTCTKFKKQIVKALKVFSIIHYNLLSKYLISYIHTGILKHWINNK